MARLADRATEQGICRFTGLVAANNRAVAGLIRKFGGAAGRWEFGTIEYEATLACREDETSPGTGARAA
jgi:hypothetical protein